MSAECCSERVCSLRLSSSASISSDAFASRSTLRNSIKRKIHQLRRVCAITSDGEVESSNGNGKSSADVIYLIYSNA